MDMEKADQYNEETVSRTFKIANEGHTMGNLLTYILDKMPETKFCSYSIRHPTETDVYIKLDVEKGHDVTSVFRRGVEELKDALKIIEDKFVESSKEYSDMNT